VCHPECGPRKNYITHRDQPAIVEFAGENAYGRHHCDCAQSSRADGDARGARDVTENCLIEERKDCNQAVDDGTEESDEDTAESEVAIFEDFETDEGLFGLEFSDDERDEAGDQRSERPADPSCAEPIVFLTFVENDLQAG